MLGIDTQTSYLLRGQQPVAVVSVEYLQLWAAQRWSSTAFRWRSTGPSLFIAQAPSLLAAPTGDSRRVLLDLWPVNSSAVPELNSRAVHAEQNSSVVGLGRLSANPIA